MDSTIVLALMAKAKRVFERERTFLSFPIAPIAYTPEELSFLTGEVSTNPQQLRMAEFSRLVNLIPEGSVWPPSEERYLWDVSEDIMKENVQFAISTRTPEEEVSYQEAFRLLYEVGEDNLRRNTPIVVAYNQYRDAWFTAQEDYNSHKVEAEFSNDPAVKARWEQVDEPRLRAKIEAIESEWRVKGFQEKVEKAQRIESALGSKSPSTTWDAWDKLFDRDIDMQIDTNNQPFVISGISPSNALQVSEWLKFTLTGAEANQLITTAPTELRNLLSPNPVDLEIDSITFEYTSAGVSRAWLATDVFKARFWRFPDPTLLLSDGKIPPSGRLPAYVAGLVFARHPVVKLKENSARNQVTFSQMTAANPLFLGFFDVTLQPAKNTLISTKVARTAPQLFKAALASPPPAKQAKVSAALGRMVDRNFLRLGGNPTVVVARSGASAAQPGSGTPQPQPQPQPVDEDIYILAFICKRLPKCPDPDPALMWPA